MEEDLAALESDSESVTGLDKHDSGSDSSSERGQKDGHSDHEEDDEEEEELDEQALAEKKKKEVLEKQLLHITTEPLWTKAQQTKQYTHPTLKKEGYIHCYTHRQIGAAANHFFRKQKRLYVIVIDKDKLSSPVKYEVMKPNLPPFPHVYGPINFDAILECKVIQKKFEKWHIELCCAPCKATGLCCKSCFTPCCSAYSQRVTLLEAEEGGLEKKYLCCNGAFCAEDCCMTECCCRKCPRCCLCMESFVCCWCAVVANRSIIQRRYGIKVDNPRSCGFAVSCPFVSL